MATTEAKRLYRVVREVHGTFHVLKEASDHLHAERRITAAERAVLERLSDGGPMTVPQMARARRCSRQHIQARVDALARRGLVGARDNPAHRRSPLIEITETGAKVFAEMRAAEEVVLERLSQELNGEDLAVTARTLAALSAALKMKALKNKD
jgi:DNA-binding MarR family transcriptional regulator